MWSTGDSVYPVLPKFRWFPETINVMHGLSERVQFGVLGTIIIIVLCLTLMVCKVL